jgi:hypothetical protein
VLLAISRIDDLSRIGRTIPPILGGCQRVVSGVTGQP